MPDNDVFRTLNQPKPWSGYNAFHSDPLLGDLTRNLARPLREEFDTIGRYVTSPEAQELAQMANTSLPQLKTHGPAGERLDIVSFHPAWHALMRRSMASGLHSLLWEPPRDADSKSKAHKLRNEYLCNVLGVGKASQDETGGFQKLGKEKWLVHIETGERATANPLMLSMVISIFQSSRLSNKKQREDTEDFEMPNTVAELYRIAAKSMLEHVDRKHRGAAPPAIEPIELCCACRPYAGRYAHLAGVLLLKPQHDRQAHARDGAADVGLCLAHRRAATPPARGRTPRPAAYPAPERPKPAARWG